MRFCLVGMLFEQSVGGGEEVAVVSVLEQEGVVGHIQEKVNQLRLYSTFAGGGSEKQSSAFANGFAHNPLLLLLLCAITFHVSLQRAVQYEREDLSILQCILSLALHLTV